MISDPGFLSETMVNRINTLASGIGYTVDPNEILGLVWVGLLEAGLKRLQMVENQNTALQSRVSTLESQISTLQAQMKQHNIQDPITPPTSGGPTVPGTQAGWMLRQDPNGAQYWAPIYR